MLINKRLNIQNKVLKLSIRLMIKQIKKHKKMHRHRKNKINMQSYLYMVKGKLSKTIKRLNKLLMFKNQLNFQKLNLIMDFHMKDNG